MEKVGAAASQVKDLRSPQSPKSLGDPASARNKDVVLTQEQANEISKIFAKGSRKSNLRDFIIIFMHYVRSTGEEPTILIKILYKNMIHSQFRKN